MLAYLSMNERQEKFIVIVIVASRQTGQLIHCLFVPENVCFYAGHSVFIIVCP